MLVGLRGGCGDKGGRVWLVGENMLLCKTRGPNLLQTYVVVRMGKGRGPLVRKG